MLLLCYYYAFFYDNLISLLTNFEYIYILINSVYQLLFVSNQENSYTNQYKQKIFRLFLSYIYIYTY